MTLLEDARKVMSEIDRLFEGYSYEREIINGFTRRYITGCIKDYSGECVPLIQLGILGDIQFGLAWVSDEGDYGSNAHYREDTT